MTTVKVSELKARLSHYLRLVRQGESVLVLDRDRPVARIDPTGGVAADDPDDEARLEELERRGVIRRGRGKLPPGWHDAAPRVEADVVAAVLADRAEGR